MSYPYFWKLYKNLSFEPKHDITTIRRLKIEKIFKRLKLNKDKRI